MNCQNVKAAIDESTRHEGYSLAVDSHLTACLNCRGYANEFDSLLALLRTHPRIEAPADFDFKLRARIARAESEQLNSGIGLLRKFWTKSFSWGPAGAALAAIALFALVSSVFINPSFQPVRQAEPNVAVALLSAEQPASPTATQEVSKMQVVKSESKLFKATSTKVTALALKPKSVSESALPPVVNNNIAVADNASSFYIRDKGQVSKVSNRSVSVGAEDAVLTKNQALSF